MTGTKPLYPLGYAVTKLEKEQILNGSAQSHLFGSNGDNR